MNNSQGDGAEIKTISRYSQVVLAAKRAKQIKEGAPILIETESTNPLTIAMEEIAQGKVTVNAASVPAPTDTTHAASDSPTRDPLLAEAQAGPLLYNGLSGTVGDDADEDDDDDAAALDMDDPKAVALAGGSDTSDEDTD